MSKHKVKAARVVVSCVVACPECGADATVLGTAWIVDNQIQLPAEVDGVVQCRACDEAGRKAALDEQRRWPAFGRGLRLAGDGGGER